MLTSNDRFLYDQDLDMINQIIGVRIERLGFKIPLPFSIVTIFPDRISTETWL